MKIEIDDEIKLRNIIKDAVRDVLEEEVGRLRLLIMPYVSDEEQKEIEESYGEPSGVVSRTLILKEWLVWKIEISNQTDKFIKRENIDDNELLSLIQKFINYLKGEDENINIKKLKGKWLGFYRIRFGRVRIILKVNFKCKVIFIDRMDYRGDVYKWILHLNIGTNRNL